jgi:transposase
MAGLAVCRRAGFKIRMNRGDLERLSRDELIELVLRLQRPEKTSRNSSKLPSSDRKEKRENSRPGGAKPGHEGHARALSDDPDAFEDHVPSRCPCWVSFSARTPSGR